jgi:hypothetical protein
VLSRTQHGKVIYFLITKEKTYAIEVHLQRGNTMSLVIEVAVSHHYQKAKHSPAFKLCCAFSTAVSSDRQRSMQVNECDRGQAADGKSHSPMTCNGVMCSLFIKASPL